MPPVAVPTTQNPLDNITYEDLYRRWELGNWQATSIDFSRDAEQWQADFTDLERKAAYWNYCLFFWGEDAVADGLSPYIDAAPLEEQKYFLATQQVDEARHAVFFNRFMKEVVGVGGDSVGDSLEAIKPELTWGFNKIFDRLVTMSDELRKDPSIPKLAAAVTLYHVVIEATLAQPGQHFITSYLSDRDLLPGFREGMEKVAADEQRHIGFGVKLLSDLREMDPEVPDAVADLLREVIPYTASVLIPPEWDMRYIECFGFTLEDIGEEGANSLETKMRSRRPADRRAARPARVPGARHRRASAPSAATRWCAPATSARSSARRRRTRRTCRSSSRRSPAAWTRAPRPSRACSSGSSATPSPGTSSSPTATRAPSAGCRPRRASRFKSSFEDFVDVAAGRQDPRKLMLRGRMRYRGDLRWLWKSQPDVPGLEATTRGQQELGGHDGEGGQCDEGEPYGVHGSPTGVVPSELRGRVPILGRRARARRSAAAHHRAAPAPDPLRHGQPAGQRAGRPGVPQGPARGRRVTRSSCCRRSRAGRT